MALHYQLQIGAILPYCQTPQMAGQIVQNKSRPWKCVPFIGNLEILLIATRCVIIGTEHMP